ncbi:MAG TPA: UDP-N-acetylmuramoyl-L-alanyl-D-glutamate--2,6-diaminopimelate ligase, partial [Dissulfurispiraceae bacterium]
MRVKDIVGKGFRIEGDTGREVSGISYDSRKIRGGEVFVAIKGEQFDGNNFIADAVQKGAAAVVYEKGSDVPSLKKECPGVAWIEVEDAREAIAFLSDAFYGRPSGEISAIGITGTNGKTTTSYLIKAILENAKKDVGLIGTISYLIKDASYDAPHTTPESPDFQSLLREMTDKGCSHVVAEVSSHSLAQRRVDYTRFKAGIFTNLTRDHLDFHRTMEDYYRAKERLFAELIEEGGSAVVNLDDPYGERLVGALKERRPDLNVLTCAIGNEKADVIAVDIKATFKGTSFTLKVRDAEGKVRGVEMMSPLVGNTNVYNMLSAICAALSMKIPFDIIKEGIAMTGFVKGRFEKVDLGQDFLAVVDYAHTEDALERLLLTARQLLEAYRFAENTEKLMRAKSRKFSMPEANKDKGKIITVIGCGGNRDKGKRSKMGEIASKLSDFVIVTSDNPRNEDPKAIIRDIEKGIKSDNYIVIPD